MSTLYDAIPQEVTTDTQSHFNENISYTIKSFQWKTLYCHELASS